MGYILLLPLFLLMACGSSRVNQSLYSVSQVGKVKGNAGVNSYFGEWKICMEKIISSKMASTDMFGIELKVIMHQEEIFLSV